MTSDRRWTGGLMNRQWQRGAAVVHPLDVKELERDVRRYLRDCAENSKILDRRYHPTEGGAVRLIYHQNTSQAAQIRAEFHRQNQERRP